MNFENITSQVCEIALGAGKFIAAEREKFDPLRAEIKAKNDLVSYVDREAEKKIIEGLKKVFPAAGFIAEENTETDQKESNWIIDPLDGTTNFIHGIPCYCVSIALAKGTEILSGVVYEVSRNEMFYSYAGGKSFLNEKIISVSAVKNINDSLIATGFPVNNFERMNGYLKSLEYFIRNTHGVRRIGSAAADLCFLACGRVDAFFEFNLKPWDVAAGALIAKNAGATVTDFSGGQDWLFGKEIMAVGKGIENEFSKIIRSSFFG
jgi:myo-inositol-1(or 4)-monophosphatase